jgi:hypothetical protein
VPQSRAHVQVELTGFAWLARATPAGIPYGPGCNPGAFYLFRVTFASGVGCGRRTIVNLAVSGAALLYGAAEGGRPYQGAVNG